MVTAEGAPRLLDFGVARLLDAAGDNEGAAAIGLTPGYAAPEQYTGAAVTTATDVYALGAVDAGVAQRRTPRRRPRLRPPR